MSCLTWLLYSAWQQFATGATAWPSKGIPNIVIINFIIIVIIVVLIIVTIIIFDTVIIPTIIIIIINIVVYTMLMQARRSERMNVMWYTRGLRNLHVL